MINYFRRVRFGQITSLNFWILNRTRNVTTSVVQKLELLDLKNFLHNVLCLLAKFTNGLKALFQI